MITDYDGPLLGAPRDASCWGRPNTRTPKQVHVAVNVQRLPGVGTWSGPTLHGEAACSPGRTPLDMDLSDRAETWPGHVRCRRPGCATRWPAPADHTGDGDPT